MSVSGVAMTTQGRRGDDLAMPFGLLVAIFLLVVAGNLAGNGVLGETVDLAPGWQQGSLLQALALWCASLFGAVLDLGTALVLIYVAVATGTAMLAYRLMRANDWPVLEAVLLLALVAGNGLILQSITLASPELFYVLAAGLLIPATRRLEAVGDVQAVLNFGLALPFLVMAGPVFAPLLPLLMLAVPFREAEARHNAGIFGAMFVVTVVPVLILVLGVLAMAARAGLGPVEMAQPFIAAFQPMQRDPAPMLALLGIAAPVALVPLSHMFMPDRRRKIGTSLLTLLLPLYVVAGMTMFAWEIAPWTPAATMLATCMGWLCATRLAPWLRWMALGLLAVGAVGMWAFVAIWADPSWLDGLMPIQLFGAALAMPGMV